MGEKAAGFVWYDLMTTDVAAATGFYNAVFGWQAKDAGMAGPPYTLLLAKMGAVGGVTGVPAQAHAASPAWLGHIGVENVDRVAEQVSAAGGAVLRAPEEIPDVGRFAVAADPGGAVFLLFHPLQAQETGGSHGAVGWHELYTKENAQAWDFYSGLFRWTKAEAHDMGPMGVYQTFAAGGAPIGGMMTQMPGMPAPPGWLYYFTVDGLDAAVARIHEAGGKVTMGPREVPGGGWIAQAVDPQGAMFAVTSAGK